MIVNIALVPSYRSYADPYHGVLDFLMIDLHSELFQMFIFKNQNSKIHKILADLRQVCGINKLIKMSTYRLRNYVGWMTHSAQHVVFQNTSLKI